MHIPIVSHRPALCRKDDPEEAHIWQHLVGQEALIWDEDLWEAEDSAFIIHSEATTHGSTTGLRLQIIQALRVNPPEGKVPALRATDLLWEILRDCGSGTACT